MHKGFVWKKGSDKIIYMAKTLVAHETNYDVQIMMWLVQTKFE